MNKKLVVIFALAITALFANTQDAFALYYHGGNGDGFAVDANIRYWVASVDGNWNDTANWSDTSGGASGFSVPGSGQAAVFDSGSANKCTVNAVLSLHDLIIESGAGTVDASGYAVTVAGSVITAGGILIAPSGAFTVAGNFTYSGGTFTHNSGTLVMDGSTTPVNLNPGSNNLYNLTIDKDTAAATVNAITNNLNVAGALDIQDGTLDLSTTTTITGAVTVGDSANQASTLKSTTASLAVNFNGDVDVNADGTFDFQGASMALTFDDADADVFTIDNGAILTLQGTTGNHMTLTSDEGSWWSMNLNAGATATLAELTPSWSDASFGSTVNAGATSTDGGNNVNWLFDGSVTLSGTLRDGIGGSGITNKTIKACLNGSTTTYTDDTDGSGNYSITFPTTSSGDMICVWVDGETEKATTVSQVDGAGGNITGFELYQNYVVIRDEGATGITNAEMNTADNEDSDITYSVDGSNNLTVVSSSGLYINTGDTFTPGGNVTVDNANCQIVGTLTLDGAYTLAINTSGTLDIDGTLNLDNNSSAIDVVGAIDLDGVLDAAGVGATINLEGNWDNAGTFTAGLSTVTLDGTTSATFEAGSSTYNNIEINKTSGTDANDNVTFQTNSATISGTLTITDGELIQQVALITGAVSLSDATSKWTNVTDNANLTLSGNMSNTGTITFDAPTGDLIQIRSSVSGTQRNWQGSGGAYAFNMTDVDVQDQTCIGGTPATITVTDGTDSGNNTNWLFGATTISGTVYTDDDEAANVGSGTAVKVVVYDDSGGAKSSFTDTTDANGAYSITNGTLADNDIICVYLDTNGGNQATTVYRCGAAGNVTNLNVYLNHVVIFNADTTNITNTDLDNSDDGDTDVLYAVSGGNLTINNNIELFLEGSTSKTFAPGGNVIVQGTGDLQIESGATLNMAGHNLTVSDDIRNAGALTQAGGTTTIDGTTKLITGGGATTFNNLTVDGTYTQDTDVTVSSTLTINDNKHFSLDASAGAVTLEVGGTIVNNGNADGEGLVLSDDTNTIILKGTAGSLRALTNNNIDFNQKTIHLDNIDIQIATNLDENGDSIILDSNCAFDALTLNGNATTSFTTGAYTATLGGALTNTFGTVTISASGAINTGTNAFISNTANSSVATSGALTCGDLTITGGTFSNTATNTIFSTGNAEISVFGATATNNTLTMDCTAIPDTKTLNASVPLGNFTINSSGTIQLLTSALDVDGNFRLQAGTLDCNSLDQNYAGNFQRDGGTTYTSTGTTTTFDGAAAQTVTSNSLTYNTITITNSHADGVIFADDFTTATLNDTTASSKLTFNAGDTYTITGAAGLNLDGGAAGTEITLISDLAGTKFTFDVTGGAQTVTYANVKDSAASTNNITANTSINSGGNDDGDPAPHWVFGNVTRYWRGTTSTDWNDSDNWSSTSGGTVGVDVPSTGDTAIFDGNGDNPCSVNITTVSLAVLDIQAGYTSKFDANGNDITASGNVTVAAGVTGELELDANSQLIVGGTLTVSGGTLDDLNGTIDVNGAVSITGGEFIAPSGNFNVAGNFGHTAGTFTHSSGTVVFDGAGATTVSGETTFYNLSCTTAGKQINFTNGTTQTVNNTLTLTGANGNLIKLRSTATPAKWDITFPNGAQTVSYIDVKDSDANTNIVTCYNSTNSLNNNANWIFNSAEISVPIAGSTVTSTPTIIGKVGAGDVVTIRGTVGAAAFTQVAQVTADANGNYRISQSDYTVGLDTGANNIRADVGAVQGVAVAITVSAVVPTTGQMPTITSPTEGAIARGNKPTISGKGLAGQTVTLTANDANDNLLLSDVATATVDGNGDWTISSTDYTTNLVKGTNYLSVTVNGVASNVRGISFVDPFGIVFDSITNNPITSATVTIFNSNGTQCTPGVEIAGTDVNPQVTTADGAYSFLCANGNYYITVDANGYKYPSAQTTFPAGRVIVAGSKGEAFTVAGVIIEMDHPVDPTNLLLKIKKDANKKEVVIGDVVTYTVTIKNETDSDVTDVYLEDKIPAGFKYISGKAILDNTQITNPTGNRPITFNIGTVSAGTTRTLKYQLVVGSGVTLGNYENTAWAKYSDETVISNKASETVKVVLDPLFDLGTVIGKVFWDLNEDGRQKTDDRRQKTEAGIGGVRIIMEDGTVITTDEDGKYHLPAIIPGRHLLRLDERTLPGGAYLTTDKVVIVDITPGILAKVNFGVNSEDRGQRSENRKQIAVKITQEREKPSPRLNVACYWLAGERVNGLASEPANQQYEFRIFTNYSLFIDKWRLEILDKDTKALARRFEGTRLTINEPILWDPIRDKSLTGQVDPSTSLRAGRNYVYILTITGKGGRQDVTREKDIIIRGQKTEDREQKTEKEIERERQKWIEQESKVNNLARQDIRIDGETIKIQNPNTKIQNVRILKSGDLQAEIPVIQSQRLSPSNVLESPQSLERPQSEVITDIILPKGEYDIQVIPQKTEDGRQRTLQPRSGQAENRESLTSNIGPLTSEVYTQHIKVGEDYLFFVGMGDAKAGYTFNRGDIEPVQQDDKFKEGFWVEGKMSYYLKGKIKGKYLITSSLDTERDKKELFRNLDPDKYYPVYGDASTINYDATNTQGMLYLLIEWDKSSILWGNFETAFTDTEFAQFSRTLYGGKIHYETVSATQFGEPHTKLVVFRARAQQRAAHNEFVGTGGSLFYLKNKDVTEGSDKVKIEVRDKITGLVLATKELEEEFDYEIDYSNGRLTFWQPISYIVESDSIISSHLLDGNPVYVVVDYEYETKDKYDEGAYGARLQQSLTDYLRIGGTYVQEEQLDKNYELKGTDAIIHLGKDIKFTGEYAESESEQVGSFISTDGGLSFTELPTGDLDKGRAYGLKSEAYLFDRLGLAGYYKTIEKGFSSASTTSQQGKELMGAAATIDLTSKTRLKVQHDIQKLIDNGNSQTQLQVGAQKTETTSVQLQHEVVTDKLKLTAEYRKQQVKEKKEQFESETNTESDVAALKADYQATKKTALSLEQQVSLSGAPNQQTTLCVAHKPNEWLSLRGKETVGNQGSATSIGASANVKDKFELSGDVSRANAIIGEITDSVSLGGKAKVDDKTEVHTTYAVTDSSLGGNTQSVVYGAKRKINDNMALTTDKSYAKAQDKLTQANTYGLTKEKDGKKLEGTFTEQKSQSDTEVSNTNIFGLSGDINDKWAAQGSFERGRVQNHDGTLSARNAGSIGLGFVDKDSETGEVRLKASSKLELRLDDGEVDKRQYLVYNAIEGKINQNTTLFAKANLSQTKNTTTHSTEAQYKELVTGVAYRPVNFDRLNLLGRYTYLEDNSPSGQTNFKDIEKEKSHTIAGEAVYDLTDEWQLVEKLAYKQGEEKVTGFDFTKTQTWLMIHRLNYKMNRDWQVGAEYRRLTQKQADDYKQGALVEVARNIGEFIQVGAGYNFTDFNDDLTHLDYTAQGPFIRLTGKFYDRTPEEIERARQKWLEEKLKQWAWELVQDELAKPDSPIMQELYRYYYLAKEFKDEGKLNPAKECYQGSLQIGRMMYDEAEGYIRGRIELEKKVKKDNVLAMAYYKEGKLQEAKELWEKILKGVEPKPILMEVERCVIR